MWTREPRLPPSSLAASMTTGCMKKGGAAISPGSSVHTGQVAVRAVSSTPVPPAPMLATAAPLPSDTTAYCIEPKWDGILY